LEWQEALAYQRAVNQYTLFLFFLSLSLIFKIINYCPCYQRYQCYVNHLKKNGTVPNFEALLSLEDESSLVLEQEEKCGKAPVVSNAQIAALEGGSIG